MNPFIDAPNLIYELVGAMFHKGRDTNSGHYVARIYSHDQKEWFNYDDESVTKLKKMEFELKDFDFEKKKKKTQGTLNDFRITVETKDCKEMETKDKEQIKGKEQKDFTSTNAYVLVYKRKLESVPAPVVVPDRLFAILQRENEIFQKEVDDTKNAKMKIQGIVESKRNAWIDIQNHLEVALVHENAVYVSRTTLETAIDIDFNPEKDKPLKIEVDDIVCMHGKVDPLKVPNCKRMSLVSFFLIKNGVTKIETKIGIPIIPRLIEPDAFCNICLSDLFEAKIELARHVNDIDTASVFMKEEGCFLISKDWFQRIFDFNLRMEEKNSYF